MPLVRVDCKGDPPLGDILVEPGIITGAVPLFNIPEFTNPAEIELPLQFRDLLSRS